MKISGHKIDLSNQDKVFFPDAKLTKGDVIDYYEKIADIMVPHMKRYGVSMQRFPEGLKGEGFYNKDAPDYFPDWIRTVEFPKREGGSFHAPIVDSKAALIYLADQAVLTHHLYLSRVDDLEHPDKMIYDLDPPENTEDFGTVRKAAEDIREVLHKLNMEAWIQTTGSKGFHVIVPLARSANFEEVRAFARDIALVLVRRNPDKYTLKERKNKRGGRIFLDKLRNAYGATAVAPYSIRAKPGATVATPLNWNEIKEGASPHDWTIENIPGRMGQKEDPWLDMMRHAYRISSRKDKLENLLEQEKPAPEEEI